MTIDPMSAKAVRALCRSGTFVGAAAGFAKGHVQANMMIVPRSRILFCISHSPGKMLVTDLMT